jgi:hypothetical protein
MIDRLRSLLRSDDFIPTSSVFPEIDIDKVDRELKLRDRAVARGQANLPQTSEDSLDAVEMDVISRIEEIRRRGLENYENNRSIYASRLRVAHTARSEIEMIASKARGDFASEVKSYRTEMAKMVQDVQKWDAALEAFQERNGLDRPAYESPSILKTLAILAFFLIAETLLNGVLFAGKNELGLVGGGFIAVLVSVVNIGIAGFSGHFARYARHRNAIGKLFGIVVILVWLAGSFFLNLGVAHFRDAVETLGDWAAATQTSMDTLLATPFDLASIESWLLMSLGCLVSIGTFLKFLLSGEPFPGYARISERRRRAVIDFEEILQDALGSLEERRDAAIEALNEASDLVRERLGDAIDALYGRRMMHSHLQAFLEQCDVKATLLLKRYRDENRALRTEDAPSHFDSDYRFPSFQDLEAAEGEGESRRAKAEQKIDEVERIVDEAVAAINADYHEALDAYSDMDALIIVDMKDKAAARRTRAEGVSVAGTVTVEEIGRDRSGRVA